MFRLPSLIALAAGLAAALPAQAQNIPPTAITLTVPDSRVCRVRAVMITPGKDASEIRFTFSNDGTTNVAFSLRLTIAGTSGGNSFSRTLPDISSGSRPSGQGTIQISGISPPLPMLTSASATANLVTCNSAASNRPLANM